ncbi:MAG TPA: hypothetical protein VF234_04895 [Limnochordia bacterium]
MAEQARLTPGPWEAVYAGQGVDGAARWDVVARDDECPIRTIAICWDTGDSQTLRRDAEENARLISAAVNAVHRLAEHLGRDPLEVAEALDLVTMMRQRDEARREVERLRAALNETFSALDYFLVTQEEPITASLIREGAWRGLRRAHERLMQLLGVEDDTLAERGGEG